MSESSSDRKFEYTPSHTHTFHVSHISAHKWKSNSCEIFWSSSKSTQRTLAFFALRYTIVPRPFGNPALFRSRAASLHSAPSSGFNSLSNIQITVCTYVASISLTYAPICFASLLSSPVPSTFHMALLAYICCFQVLFCLIRIHSFLFTLTLQRSLIKGSVSS